MRQVHYAGNPRSSGPILVPLNIRCRNMSCTPKRLIILGTTQILPFKPPSLKVPESVRSATEKYGQCRSDLPSTGCRRHVEESLRVNPLQGALGNPKPSTHAGVKEVLPRVLNPQPYTALTIIVYMCIYYACVRDSYQASEQRDPAV